MKESIKVEMNFSFKTREISTVEGLNFLDWRKNSMLMMIFKWSNLTDSWCKALQMKIYNQVRECIWKVNLREWQFKVKPLQWLHLWKIANNKHNNNNNLLNKYNKINKTTTTDQSGTRTDKSITWSISF